MDEEFDKHIATMKETQQNIGYAMLGADAGLTRFAGILNVPVPKVN